MIADTGIQDIQFDFRTALNVWSSYLHSGLPNQISPTTLILHSIVPTWSIWICLHIFRISCSLMLGLVPKRVPSPQQEQGVHGGSAKLDFVYKTRSKKEPSHSSCVTQADCTAKSQTSVGKTESSKVSRANPSAGGLKLHAGFLFDLLTFIRILHS